MNHWIFSVTPHKGSDYSLSAEEIFNQRMRDTFWGLNAQNVNFNNLNAGDKVIFYVGRPKKVFAGNVVLASAGMKLSAQEKKKIGHGISFYRSDAGVWLREIEIWQNPQSVVSLLQKLSFIKNKEKWYAHFQGGIIRCSESDYTTIIESKNNFLEVGGGWSEIEVAETVNSYFEMLKKELRGEPYNKTSYRNELISKIRRSNGAIEFKFQNISAALRDKGHPYIEGYKPLGNYQKIIEDVIDAYLESNPETLNLIQSSIEEVPNKDLNSINYSTVLKDPPPASENSNKAVDKKRSYKARKYDFTNREWENRKLGKKGEEFVINYERHRLTKAGKADLADKVERISETQGDGAGYDIRSYEIDRTERFIEVKTTNFAKEFPFYITANELDFSEDYSGKYYLYRVFNFKKSPRLFIIQGSLKERFVITPATFKISY